MYGDARRAVDRRAAERVGRVGRVGAVWAAMSTVVCVVGALSCTDGDSRAVTPTAAPPERIVLVVVDTLRRDHVSPYAARDARAERVPTPNLEKLAARGQVFADAWSSYHQTTMSMSALFTGRTPSIERGHERERLDWTGETWCGLERLKTDTKAQGERDQCIPSSVSTLAEALREQGYWTVGVTSNELLYRPGGYERGFDRWIELPNTPVAAGRVNHAVQAVLSNRGSDRFFLYVHYMDVHDYAARGWTYGDSVRIVDQAFGRLMAMLEQKGLLDGAVVIFTSDHGEHLPGEKHFTYANRGHTGSPSFDTLLAVPLIVAPPVFDQTEGPLRSDDVHRMIRRLAGAEPGPDPELRAGEIYLSERHYQTYRYDGWKSFRHRETGKHFVVDLAADPGERRNVGERAEGVRDAHAGRIEELAKRLGAPEAVARELAPEDRERLRALGYEAVE